MVLWYCEIKYSGYLQLPFLLIAYLMALSRFALFSLLALLSCLPMAHSFLDQKADQAIKSAIISAVQDGLTLINTTYRKQYWYYLNSTKMIVYNVTLKDQSINYIIFYQNGIKIFRLNADLSKITWLPFINSLVEYQVSDMVLKNIVNQIRYVDSNHNLVSLNNTIGITIIANRAPAKNPNPTPTPPTPSKSNPHPSGIIILNSSNNLLTNSP